MFSDALSGSNYACSALNADHYLLDFECGRDSNLADWLRSHAQAYQQEGLSQVWILHRTDDVDKVRGYFTLSAHMIRSNDVSRRDKVVHKDNGNRLAQFDQLPAQLLGKFALDREVQGQGVGALLMSCVYAVYLDVSAKVGSKFLVVDAHKPALALYYQNYYGFVQATNRSGPSMTLYRSSAGIREDMAKISSPVG